MAAWQMPIFSAAGNKKCADNTFVGINTGNFSQFHYSFSHQKEWQRLYHN
jgi:hypothetical protein